MSAQLGFRTGYIMSQYHISTYCYPLNNNKIQHHGTMVGKNVHQHGSPVIGSLVEGRTPIPVGHVDVCTRLQQDLQTTTTA